MSTPPPLGPSLPFEPAALTLFHQYHDQFAADLRDEANDIALRAHRPMLTALPSVTGLDLAKARERAYARRRARFSWRELILILGAALFGAGLENGGTEALAGRFGGTFALWVIAASAGAILVILALAFL